MRSLFFFLVTAQVLLSQLGNSSEIAGIKLKSPEDFLTRHSTDTNFNFYFTGGDGGNKTIITLMNGLFTVRIIHRNETKLGIEFSSNDSLVLCELDLTGDSHFVEASLVFSSVRITLYEEPICIFNTSLSENTTVHIGDPADGRSFTGIVVDLKVKMQLFCDSNAYQYSSDQLSFWSKRKEYVERNFTIIEICKKVGRIVVINDAAVTGFDDIQSDYCKHLGGRRLYTNETKDLQAEIKPKANQICRSQEDPKNAAFWTTERCKIQFLESFRTKQTCVPEKACFICLLMKRKSKLRVREDDVIFKVDDLEFIEEDNSTHFMLNSTSATITFENTTWQLQIKGKRDAYYLKDSFHPFGKREWNSKFANNKSQNISLSNCWEEMCTDGKCYLTTQHCDGYQHCSDAIDEKDCNVPYFRNTERSTTLIVGYNISIVNIDEIEAKNESLTMNLGFTFEWREHRIDFKSTKIEFINGTRLPFNPYRDLTLTNCVKTDDVEFKRLKNVISIKGAAPVSESTAAVGANVTIRNTFNIKFKLPCHYKYSYFPFDQQNCSLCIGFKPNNETTVLILNITNREIPIDKSENRGDFSLKEVTQEPYSNGSMMKIQFDLKSMSSYHLLTSFTPSALMCLIAYCTLYFNLGFFPERIGVAATSLLTLVVLFTDTSDRIVKTSYVKLIDGWFIWCMSFTAAIVIINSFFHYLMHHEPLTIPSLLSCPMCPKRKKKKKKKNSTAAYRFEKNKDEVIAVEIAPEEHEVNNEPSTVVPKAVRLVPLERKLNIVARLVLMPMLLTSIMVVLLNEWNH